MPVPRQERSNAHVPLITLYHATLQANYWQVRQEGLLTANDRRKKNRIWLAEMQELTPVIQHLAAVRKLSVSQWCILAVRTDLLPSQVKRCGRKGIYYVECDIPVWTIELLDTRWYGFELDDLVEEAEPICFSYANGRWRPEPQEG